MHTYIHTYIHTYVYRDGHILLTGISKSAMRAVVSNSHLMQMFTDEEVDDVMRYATVK